jgi:hypothetical protein
MMMSADPDQHVVGHAGQRIKGGVEVVLTWKAFDRWNPLPLYVSTPTSWLVVNLGHCQLLTGVIVDMTRHSSLVLLSK